jgi:hypothetical protein
MPGYKDLLRLIRSGKGPAEIIAELNCSPTELRRMLRGKRFRDALALERQLAATVARHKTAAGAGEVVSKLSHLTRTKNPETVRKVCVALLNEAVRGADDDAEPTDENADGRFPEGASLKLQMGDACASPAPRRNERRQQA